MQPMADEALSGTPGGADIPVGLPATPASSKPATHGTLHIYVAFDWGEQIRLDDAASHVPASRQELPRRRRTPPSFTYRPPPLHLALEPVPLDLPEIGAVQAAAGLTLFDFGAVS